MAERSLRVLLVLGETAGGIGRHVRLLAEQLPAVGVIPVVAGPASALAAVGGLPELATHLVPIGTLARTGRARRALNEALPDVDLVHAHGVRAGAVAALSGAGSRRPLVVTWHNAALVRGLPAAAHRALSVYVARRADLVLGASPDLTAAARRAGARDARDTFVVAPPLPPPSRSREETRADLQLGGVPMVLAVGRLQAQKRFDVLVDAVARWDPRRGPKPVVVVAGAGPDDATLRARIQRADAPVRLLGARGDISDLLLAADLVVLPSAWEARPLVAQEALRAGVPLVVTRVGGVPDLVGDAALIVPAADPVALGDAIARLLADADLRTRLASAGRARAGTWPSIEASVAELAASYRALVGR